MVGTPRISRRRFFRLLLGGVIGTSAAAIGGTAYATRIEPASVELTRVDMPLRHLDRAFDGFTVAQISDFHLGEWMTLNRMLDIAAQVNALNPDLIVVTGDLISAIWSSTRSDVTQALRALHAAEGVAVILGNHDHWTDAGLVRGTVLDAGARLLLNTHMVIGRSGAALFIAGVDDIWEKQHDLSRALDGIPPDSPVILLAHEPDYADEVALTGQIGLQLSGHSHGGQVRLPFIGAPLLPYLGRKYDLGLYEVSGMALYVNRGLGMISPYVRFACRPEITLFTLRSGGV